MSEPITPDEQIESNNLAIRAYQADATRDKRKLNEREKWRIQQLRDYNDRLALLAEVRR